MISFMIIEVKELIRTKIIVLYCLVYGKVISFLKDPVYSE